MKTLCTILVTLCLLTLHYKVNGQVIMQEILPDTCYHHDEHIPTRLAPNARHVSSNNGRSETLSKTAQFEVNYSSSFPAEAKPALEYALNIWSRILKSSVPIRVNASFQSLGSGVLASANASYQTRDFHPSVPEKTFYVAALAEAIAGQDFNSGAGDINIRFNSGLNWYYGTDLNPGNNFDFVTIALHEIGHGLGFTTMAYYYASDGTGALRDRAGFKATYSDYLYDGDGTLVLSKPDYSVEVGTDLTGNDLYYGGKKTLTANSGKKARIFAPSRWNTGSSISHLNEGSYPAGTPNSIMTPRFGKSEANHFISDMIIGMLADMGWPINPEIYETPTTDPEPEPEPDPDPITYLPPVNVANPESGVKYYYYPGSWQQLPDPSQIVAADSGVVTDFGSFSSQLGGTFLLQLEGYFDAPAEGSYTIIFQGADDLYLQLHNENGYTYSGTVDAPKDSVVLHLQAGMHPFKVFYLRKQEEVAFQHNFRGPDQQEQALPMELLYIDAEANTPVAENPEPSTASELHAGLKYAYYEGDWNSIPNFQQLQPNAEGTADNIDLNMASRQDHFALSFTGLFNVPQSGNYTFYLNANEGSELYLDDQSVLSKGPETGDQEISISLQLSQGLHPIRLNYFENSGEEKLELYVQLEGYGRRAINQNELFHEQPAVASMISLEKQAHMFPNPVKDKLTIAYANLGTQVEVSIYDSMGKARLHFTSIRSGQELDLGALEKGIYQLKIRTEDGQTFFKRLIKN